MLPGFNHNIKYKNKIFHIQTEDSGEENPIIISHIFIGGNIIATKKTNYSHLLGKENLFENVKAIMENQHKELIKELITGKYDSHPLLSEEEYTSSYRKEITESSHTINTSESESTSSRYNSKQKDTSPFKPISTTSNFTVFGENTISEESLDRIILKFLQENKIDKNKK